MLNEQGSRDRDDAQLEREGFCVIRSVLSCADVDLVYRRVRYIAAHASYYRHLGVHFTPSSEATRRGSTDPLRRFEQIGNLPFLDRVCRDHLLAHPRLAELAASFLGPDFDVIHAGFFVKAARGGCEVPWHQDSATWGIPDGAWPQGIAPPIFDFWIAFDPAEAENGCLQVLPGSHRAGIAAHHDRGGLLAEADPVSSGVDPAGAVAIRAAPGDMVLYHQDLFHRSDENGSERSRLSAAGTLVSHEGSHRLRALLPTLETLEKQPVFRNGRKVEVRDSLPARAVPATLWFHRLRRKWRRRGNRSSVTEDR